MFGLTRKTGYGLIAMTHLARLGDGSVASAREIAGQADVPASMLMNVLKDLSSAGFVKSTRGVNGGYRLSIDPGEVSIADLVDAMEGPMRQSECISADEHVSDDGPCQIMDRCPIADPVHRVHRRVHDFLRNITLAEVLEPAYFGSATHGD